MNVFLLPDLGEGLTEAEIIGWRVAVGQAVAVDQVVVDVETAKAAVEVPVPFAGTVVAIHAEPGTVVAVGQPLISVGSAADEGSGNVLIGYGTAHRQETRRRRVKSRSAVAPAEPSPLADRPAPNSMPSVLAPKVISPLVRRQAAAHGIDVGSLVPSGTGGVVLRRDVEAAIERQSVPVPIPPTPADNDVVRIPLRGSRRIIAEKLSRSRAEIPDVTTWVDADATGLLAARDALREAGTPVGVLALLGRMCVAGLARFGDLNTSVDTERSEILRRRDIHLGFAAQTDHGLVVPVVHDAHAMTTLDLAAELGRLTELARAGKLSPRDLTGGTFTINNYGVFGVDGSTPIINHPEAALFGIGRIADKPWVHNGQLAVRKVVQLSLTFDHRVCDGGIAGGYLRFIADCVENPLVLLAGL